MQLILHLTCMAAFLNFQSGFGDMFCVLADCSDLYLLNFFRKNQNLNYCNYIQT